MALYDKAEGILQPWVMKKEIMQMIRSNRKKNFWFVIQIRAFYAEKA